MDTVRFEVPGEPVSKERPRVTRTGGTYTPKRTEVAEHKVGWWFKNAAHGWRVDPDADFHVTMRFYAKTRRRRDIDNMIKLVFDSLNKIAWKDDTQITRLVAEKHYDKERPRTEVEIVRVTQKRATP